MATWAELSDEQKSIYQAWERDMRGSQAAFHQVLNTFVEINNGYNAQITAMNLDGAEVVPNSSGLGGAASLTKTEAVNLVSHLQGAVSSYNTTGHKNLRNKAAGINATL